MLFRQESVRHFQAKSDGCVIVAPSRLGVVGAVLAGLIACGVLSGLAFGSYPKRQTVPGLVAPDVGLAKLIATRAGVLASLAVDAGDTVAAGQRLAMLSGGQFSASGASLQADVLVQLQAQQAMLDAALLREQALLKETRTRLTRRLAGIGHELDVLAEERAAVQAQHASATDWMHRIQDLAADGYVSEFDLAQRRSQILGFERELGGMKRQRQQLRNERGDVQARLAELDLESDRQTSAIRQQQSELRQQQARVQAEKDFALVAPAAGVVTAINARPGEQLVPGQLVLAIVPADAELVADLLVPSAAIGFVEPGQQVRLRYAAFPYERYGAYHGTVAEISQTTLRPDEWPTGIPVEQAVYRVRVTLERQDVDVQGGTRGLAVGMLLEADIIQERQPLWAWLLEPLLAMRGRV